MSNLANEEPLSILTFLVYTRRNFKKHRGRNMREPLRWAFQDKEAWHGIAEFLRKTQDPTEVAKEFSDRFRMSRFPKDKALSQTCKHTGVSLLSLSAYLGNLEAVKYLLSQNVSHTGFGDLLFWSKEQEHLIRYLKGEFEKDNNSENRFPGVTLAHINAALGDEQFFNDKRNKEKLAWPNYDGITPGYYAYFRRHENLMKWIELKTIIVIKDPKNLRFPYPDYKFIAFCLYILGQNYGLSYTKLAMENFNRRDVASRIGNILGDRFLVSCLIQTVLQTKNGIHKFPDHGGFNLSDTKFSRKTMLENAWGFSPKDWLELAKCYEFINWSDPAEKKKEMSAFLESYNAGLIKLDLRIADNNQTDEDDLRTWAGLFFHNGDEKKALGYLSKIQQKKDEDFRLLAHCDCEIGAKTRLWALNKITTKIEEDYRAIDKVQKELQVGAEEKKPTEAYLTPVIPAQTLSPPQVVHQHSEPEKFEVHRLEAELAQLKLKLEICEKDQKKMRLEIEKLRKTHKKDHKKGKEKLAQITQLFKLEFSKDQEKGRDKRHRNYTSLN